jgi:two-component system, OmpR family, sensor kinase
MMRAAGRRLLPVTLRGRLIAGLVALLAIGCATVGVTTYFRARDSLMREVGAQLQLSTGTWFDCVSAGGPGQGPGSWSADSSADSPAGGTAGGTAEGTAQSASGTPPDLPPTCAGLAAGTLQAYVSNGTLKKWVVKGRGAKDASDLSAADQQILRTLPVGRIPASRQPGSPANTPSYVRSLDSAHGEYDLTAVYDPDRDAVCITGVPLGMVDDTLHDLAVTELLVFGAVLLLAGVLGTAWVGLSLRPLRRVAATASQVAELPLESGAVELPAGVPDTDPRTETGQVGAAFNRMLGHMQTALARRNASETRLRRFAADASHELRTPLASIRGYAELALRHPGDAPETVTHALSRVLSESTRMTVLVDDLLLLARLDAGRPLGREPVDMSRLAIDAASDAPVARPGHRWVLDLPDDPVVVHGDEHRLQQVLVNLLSNAGRHTPEGTTVTVKASTDALPDAELPAGEALTVRRGTPPPPPSMVFTVTDDGPGITPELLPDLFERFTRADTARSHADDAPSTGLGLAIVDAVIAAHHGTVTAASRPGMTRFTIVLPRLAEPAISPARRPRSARKTLHRTV